MSARAMQLVDELRRRANHAPTSIGVRGLLEQDALQTVAEWVVDELGWIPPEALVTLQREHDELEAAVDRVRRLHDQDDSVLARGAWCPADGQPEPCQTTRALNGPPPRPTTP